jgi:hypothetical protein
MNNEIPVCLNRKDQLCNSGYEKRVENTGDKSKKKKNYNRWFQLIPDYGWNVS